MVATSYESLIARIEISPSGCWLWQGKIDRDGYGKVKYLGQSIGVHVAMYELARGGVPRDRLTGRRLQVGHLCHDQAVKTHTCDGGPSCIHRRCCNPDHLEAQTAKANSQAGVMPARTACPAGHEYTEDNTYIDPNGARQCRTCRRDRDRQTSGYKGNVRHGQETHCRNGHPYSIENTYVSKQGYRTCRTCALENQRRHKAKKRNSQ